MGSEADAWHKISTNRNGRKGRGAYQSFYPSRCSMPVYLLHLLQSSWPTPERPSWQQSPNGLECAQYSAGEACGEEQLWRASLSVVYPCSGVCVALFYYCHWVAVWQCYWTLEMKWLFQLIANNTCLSQLLDSNSLRFQSTRLERRKVPNSKLFAVSKKNWQWKRWSNDDNFRTAPDSSMRRSACSSVVNWGNLCNEDRTTFSYGYFCQIISPLAFAVYGSTETRCPHSFSTYF